MDIKLTGHNIEVTPGIKDHVEKKIGHLSKHGAKITNINVSFHIENKDQIAKAIVLTLVMSFLLSTNQVTFRIY